MSTNNFILIVDDDDDTRMQERIILEGAGYTVKEATGESEARTIIESESPDLAIVDLMMEETDGGFALCYEIKEKDRQIPVILVSGVTHETGLEFDASTEEERSWVKADCFLAKPIRSEQLLQEVGRLLKR